MSNAFVNAAINDSTITYTENGDKTYSTSLNACVDLFFQAGALRAATEGRINTVFSAAYAEDPDLAVRVALWARDVREGAGERKFFRTVIQWLEKYQPDHLLRILHLVPFLGRWDDLFSVMNTDRTARAALQMYSDALLAGDGLAAKWAPREKHNKLLAARIRSFMGYTAPNYRKLLASASKTVEQLMCAKNWSEINYSHVPSVASARYAKAFRRNDEGRYTAYLEAVRTKKVDPSTGKIAKINTGAVYPYDVVKSGVDDVTADTMWNNLPDFVPEGVSFMPIVDVSGSMMSPAGEKGSVTCLDVSLSLGLYLAERNKSAFKDLFITFSTNPQFQRITGASIRDKIKGMVTSNWQMSTNLDKAMNLIIDTGVRNRVPAEDMPNTLLILSDMEFNGTYGAKSSSVSERTKKAFTDAGYSVPNIVWWNIQSRNGSTPVRAGEKGMSLVSGFSPSIVKNLLNGEMTPVGIMLSTVNKDRYAH